MDTLPTFGQKVGRKQRKHRKSWGADQLLLGHVLFEKLARLVIWSSKKLMTAFLIFAAECPARGVAVSPLLSLTIDGTKQTELSARLGIVPRNCSICFTKLANFLTDLEASSANCLKSHQKITTKAYDAEMQVVANVMEEAAQTIEAGLQLERQKIAARYAR